MPSYEIIYAEVIVMGQGEIVCDILSQLSRRRYEQDFLLKCVEYGAELQVGIIKEKCRELKCEYYPAPDENEALKILKKCREKTLIISAGNHFIFPKEITKFSIFTIINFHNALLPKYPGRNAPTWAIWNEEKETGATWHYVDAGVDTGRIILQKKCGIDADTKAYILAKEIMNLAALGFDEIIDEILNGNEPDTTENFSSQQKMCYSWMIPSDGFFKLERDSGEKIYRLLRATDYGKSEIFPAVRTEVNGRMLAVRRYAKAARSETTKQNIYEIKDDKLYIYMDEMAELKISYKFV